MKFSRLISVFCAALLLLSLAGCGRAHADVPAGMQRASAETCDYDLFVPKEWVVTESGNAASAYKSDSDPTSVSVMSWAMSYIDSTVEEWWETYKGQFEEVFTDFTVESEEATLLGGEGANKYVYTGVLGENTYRYTQYASVRGGVVYLLTFTELANGEDHTADFSAIVDSFAWR